MRWFSAMLSVYFVVLSLVPCADFNQDLNDGLEQIITEHNHSGHDHNAPADDMCSPFCMCHCCHTHVVGSEVFALTVISLFEDLKTSAYSERLLTADEQIPPRPPQA